MPEHSPLPFSQAAGVIYDSRMELVAICGKDSEYPIANANLIVTAVNSHEALVEAIQGLLERYTNLVGSGDCGFWNAEEEPQVIAARAALRKAGVTDATT